MYLRDKKSAIALILLSVGLLQGCKNDDEIKQPKPLSVSTIQVEAPVNNQFRSFKGTVAPADLTPLSFRVEGELEAILVRKGQKVRKGELLAKLDAGKLNQKLADAQAQYELAVKQHRRGKDLLTKKMVSQSEYDELTATMRIASVSYQIAKNNLEYTRLVAPFDGYISEVPKKSFENASPGEEVLSIYRGDIVRIRVAISDAVLSMINPDQTIREYAVDTRFFGDDRQFVSYYYEHSSEPAEGSNAFEFWLEMPQVEPAILPGTSVNLDVDMIDAGMRITQGYLIPLTALDPGTESNNFFVWKMVENRAQKQAVEIIQINSDGVVVTQGVNTDDILINSGLAKLRDGAQVAVAHKENR